MLSERFEAKQHITMPSEYKWQWITYGKQSTCVSNDNSSISPCSYPFTSLYLPAPWQQHFYLSLPPFHYFLFSSSFPFSFSFPFLFYVVFALLTWVYLTKIPFPFYHSLLSSAPAFFFSAASLSADFLSFPFQPCPLIFCPAETDPDPTEIRRHFAQQIWRSSPHLLQCVPFTNESRRNACVTNHCFCESCLLLLTFSTDRCTDWTYCLHTKHVSFV